MYYWVGMKECFTQHLLRIWLLTNNCMMHYIFLYTTFRLVLCLWSRVSSLNNFQLITNYWASLPCTTYYVQMKTRTFVEKLIFSDEVTATCTCRHTHSTKTPICSHLQEKENPMHFYYKVTYFILKC